MSCNNPQNLYNLNSQITIEPKRERKEEEVGILSLFYALFFDFWFQWL